MSLDDSVVRSSFFYAVRVPEGINRQNFPGPRSSLRQFRRIPPGNENRLSGCEDGPNAYSAKLERGLNFGKKHEEALQAPVEHGVPTRKARNDNSARGGDIHAF